MDLGVLGITVFGAVIGGLILGEIIAWSPRLSGRFTRLAADRLPLKERTRYREEWLAYLDDMPTGGSKLVAALGFVFTAEQIRWKALARGIGVEVLLIHQNAAASVLC